MRALVVTVALLLCAVCHGADMPPKPTHITTPIPGHLAYPQVVQLLQKWEQEAPELLMVAPIGNSKRGVPIYAIRLTNERVDVKYKYRVLVAMSIHGNEPLAAATGMGWLGLTLQGYGDSRYSYINELVNKREVYFVPVVSPDSFPTSRKVEGVDPNRDFYKQQSCYPVECLKRFATQLRFSAVLSGHSFGRVLLYPYGDTHAACPHDAQYRKFCGELSKLNGYGIGKLSENYPWVIVGVEDDWYYRKFGAFAITYEFGTRASHDTIPTYAAIQEEVQRTYSSAIHFFCFAPVALKGEAQ